MLNTNKLRGIIAERRTTIATVAMKIGVNEHTLGRKLKSGVMTTAELEKLVAVLEIQNPWETLFSETGKGNQAAT